MCKIQLIRLTGRKCVSDKAFMRAPVRGRAAFQIEPRWNIGALARLSAIRTSAGMDVLPLFVHKQQDEGQREQSQDAGCDGQSHWYGAWRIAREKVRVAFTGQRTC